MVTSSTPRSPCGPFVHRPLQQVEEGVDGRVPQLLLRAEVVVEQRLGDAGPRRDLARRRAVEGALREQVDGGGHDPVACAVLASAPSLIG